MRRRLKLLGLVLTFGVFAGPLLVHAQDGDGQGTTPADAFDAADAAAVGNPAETPDPSLTLLHRSRGYAELVKLWKSRRAIIESEPERADEQFERVRRAAREAGVRRLDAFAVALLREAAEASDEGRFALAERRLSEADALAPGLPEVLDVRATVALDEAPWAVHRWVQLKVKGTLARIQDFQRRMLLISDVVLSALLALGFLVLLFAVTQLVRYAPHIFHDLGQAFPSTARLVLLAALGVLAAVPLVYGFGPILLLFPLAVIVWSYQSRGERVLSVFFVILIGATPWLLRIGDRLTEAGTGLTQAAHALSLNPSDSRALEVVEAAAQDDDWLAQAVVGLAYKRLGRLADAEAALRAALEPSKDQARGTIANNLGNVLFAQGKGKGADEAYEEARNLLPNRAEPAFNQHRLYRRQGRGDEAETAMQVASGIDAQAVATWNGDDNLNLNRYVVDLDLPTVELVQRAVSDLVGPTALSRRAWVTLAGPVPTLIAPVGALAALLLFVVLFRLGPRLLVTFPCMRCGRPAPSYAGDGPPDHPQCEQCVNLFVRNVVVDRRVRFQKEQSIARLSTLRRWLTRGAGVVFPGLVDLIRGQALRGILAAAVAIVILLRLIQPDGLLVEPVMLGQGAEPPTVTQLLFGAVLVVLWGWHALRAFRWKERF